MAKRRKKDVKTFRTIPGEEWKLVEGTEEYYISNKGRFRKNNKLRSISIDDSGYCRCNIGHRKYRVHRLVAEAFIPNPDNLPVVDHIDNNKQNNCVENLRWCTQQQNSQYAKDMGLGMNRVHSMVIAVNTENDAFLYNTQADAARATGVDKTSLGKVANGKERSRKGWRFFRVEHFTDCRE